MKSPYSGLPQKNFWKTGVSQQSPDTIADFWQPKFPLSRSVGIATAGSCFAQHIARYLRATGATVLDVEPPPAGLSATNALKYGYSIYSARYGNIYSARHLLQLAKEAFGRFTPAGYIWERDGRFFDAMRPTVEPGGLPSAEAVQKHRTQHLHKVRRLFGVADVWVFTLGLTEAWIHEPSGTVYPTAPGTVAGSYDPAIHSFRNFDFLDIYEDFVAFRKFAMKRKPSVKFLLTVSPVPLTATASDQHVLVATTYSKAVLRAVAGKLAMEFDNVDYFPSFDLIASAFSRGAYYADGSRQITEAGVETVMRLFFQGQPGAASTPEDVPHGVIADSTAGGAGQNGRPKSQADASLAVCDDILLDAFSR